MEGSDVWLSSCRGMSDFITGHYHHFRAKQQGDRTWFQSPSLDKSIDFTARSGMWSHPGVLTFTVNKKGWDNLKFCST